jgi:hypothetical protein
VTHLRPVAFVALLALLGSSGWTTCLGWQPTAAMRAACCKADDHPCAGVKADDCCAQGEQQRQPFPSGSVTTATLPPVLPVALLLAMPPPRVRVAEYAHASDAHRRVPTHLLLSVLLV